jgi:hypothetical protein
MKGFMRTRISLPSAIRTHVRQLSLLAPAFLLLTNTIAVRAQTPNPAANVTFDEGSGTVAHDTSGNNNDATLLGGAGWTTGLVGPGALNLMGAAGAYADSADIIGNAENGRLQSVPGATGIRSCEEN